MCYNSAMCKKRSVQALIYLLAVALFFSCFGCSTGKGSSGLVISEVVSSNQFSLTTESLGSPDWVEFYNGTSTAINLKGYGFSDNLRNLHKFVFGDVIIPAGGYVVLYLTNADGVEDPDAPVAGFGLSKSGENLFLTDPYYGLVQELVLPALPTDVAYARNTDGNYGYTLVTTPNAPSDEIVSSLSDIYDVSENGLTISEILPYPNDGEAWVELYNASSEAIRLEDFFLSDNPATAKRFQLHAGTLEPGGYLVYKLSGVSEKTANDGSLQANFRIGTNDTAIYLANASGTVIDSLTWDASLATGLSVLPEEQYTAFPTPAAANSTLTFESPTVQESDGKDPLCINEVLQKNSFTLIDQDGDRSDWVELYNRSSEAVSLNGYFLSDDASAPFRFALPDQMLAAGDYLVVFLSGKDRVQDGEIHASFQLASNETEIYLTNANSFTRDTFALVADCPADVSIGRAEDGSTVFYAYPTPWYENATPYPTLDEAYHTVPKVTINEVFPCAAYGDDTPDWVEFKNNTDQAVSLKGWYLSDSLSELKRWQFPDVTIPAGGYTVINATNGAVEDSLTTASFSIAEGETIYLSDPNGCRVDSVETGTVRAGGSIGRLMTASNERVFYDNPTPGEANGDVYTQGYAPKPYFSDDTIRHTEAFALIIRCTDPSAEIRYTTDGSTPTAQSTRYQGPITIDRNTVIRAASFQSGFFESDIETRTYLFNVSHTLPILCLTSDPGNLVGPDGIMANANLFNDRWERAAVIEYQSDEEKFSVNCGIRLHGNMTRQTNGYGKPSMKLCFRSCYGNDVLNYPLFEDGRTTVFHNLLLRNGSDMRLAVIRDELITNIAYRTSPSLCVMTAQYVAAYFNGEYMGLYALKEAMGSGYFAEHFGVSEDSVEMHRPYREENKDFVALMNYCKAHDLTQEEYYRYVEERVDFDSMIDWMIYEAYSANSDLGMNVRYYRSTEGDGKWHYALYDLDLSMKSDASFNALMTGAWNIIPRKLMKSQTFQDRLLKRLAYLLQNDLSQESVLAEYDRLIDQIDEEMVLERARWPKDLDREWSDYAQDVKKEILKDRAGQLKQSIAECLGRPLSEIEAYFTKG